ncbi:hypothetical protein GCM10020000_87840 [Streptomyces olivoverticillatus]
MTYTHQDPPGASDSEWLYLLRPDGISWYRPESERWLHVGDCPWP